LREAAALILRKLGPLIRPNFDLKLHTLLEYDPKVLNLLGLNTGNLDDDVVSGNGLCIKSENQK
jgi:hypothetical protein